MNTLGAIDCLTTHRALIYRSIRRVPNVDHDDAFGRTIELVLTKTDPGLSGQELLSWAIVTARRVALRQLRKPQHRLVPDNVPDHQVYDPDTLSTMDARDSLRSLPREQRIVVVLSAAGWKHAEIAYANGWTLRQVRRYAVKAREATAANR